MQIKCYSFLRNATERQDNRHEKNNIVITKNNAGSYNSNG